MPLTEPSLSDQSLRTALAPLEQRTILCLGDIMLDVEVCCDRPRVSPEAPVLVLREGAHRDRPGGAGNVALAAAALGAKVLLAGMIGEDPEGERLRRIFGEHAITVQTAPDPLRPTTRKTRHVAEGQQLLRLDREDCTPLADAAIDHLFAGIERHGHDLAAILVSDYGKGVVTRRAMERCQYLAMERGLAVLVDPKGNDWRRYGAIDLIKPNASELSGFTGLPCDSDAQVEVAICAALANCHADAILVTRSERGASLGIRGDQKVLHLAARTVEVADVCGAGDTNLAALGCMIAAGLPLPAAMEVAQAASGLAVQRRGNAVVTADDLLVADSGSHKIRAACELAQMVRAWQAQGLRVGFTNGCFDLLHPGHVRSLELARRQCDRLVVGLNSDASVGRLKGPGRPVVTGLDRALVLAGLAVVDAICQFDEDTPHDLIERLQPDVLIKGGDYNPDALAGADSVRQRGGEVVVTDYLSGRSTSAIIAQIRSASAPTDQQAVKQ